MKTKLIRNNAPSFGQFIKIKGKAKDVDDFRKKLLNHDGDFITLGVKQPKNRKNLYIMSGRDFDKFIKLTKKVFFFDLRTNLEHYFKKEPIVMTVKKATEKWADNKLNL